MATRNTMVLPKLKLPREFEMLCCEVAESLIGKGYRDYELVGKPGDVQDGVDIRSGKDEKGKRIYIQCKNYLKEEYKGSEFLILIKQDMEKAVNAHKDSIERFVVMTAMYRKKSYQEAIDTEKNWPGGKEPLVFYWDDIERIVFGDLELIKDYFPNIFYINYAESWEYTSNYFFNPENHIIDNGIVSIKPRLVSFSYDAKRNVIIKAQMFVCNGMAKEAKIKGFEYISIGTEEELICDASFNVKLNIKSNEYVIHDFYFEGEQIKTNRLVVPNIIRCYWKEILEDDNDAIN